ncbi:type II toxin-antitoxin system Phd/YefM family antitoxin [Coraliomargarita parva]|uniref:type II toxin-antitoxin system Phd/YefM family antitoxin n=1 Tax=Coraliomargarita parva TaxID=3014050 RepID=UPI0022B2F5B1|nr:type II toxin-antitoxin system Phd/YefM family antitoxin [Coraliomargarita parva]
MAEAKARFSEAVASCAEEPQILYNRKKPVAALIDIKEYEAFLEYKKSTKKKSLAEMLDELEEINQREPEMDELPPRTSRPVPYFDDLDDE